MYRRSLKRAFDVTFSAVGLALLAPLLAGLALCVWFDSGRPILYRGVRTGRHGRPFRIFKFRTMVVDAERAGGGTTGDGDPRITRVGRWLRRHKLDELPQLLNVLKGDMSLVGPRPELERYTREYGPQERIILSVRPGITDFASLEFIRLDRRCGSVDPDRVYETEVLPEKNRLRALYARDVRFAVDVKILARTFLGLMKP